MKFRKPIFFLLLLAVPNVCLAEAGQVSGGLIIAWLVTVTTGWTLFCVLAFFLFRKLLKRSFSRSFFLSFALFMVPVVYLCAVGVYAYFEVKSETPIPGTATHPITLEGAVFPAGSRVQYQQNGIRFWDRKPVQVESDTPVMLGSLSITGLKVDESSGVTGIILSQNHTIDSWPCVAIAGMWTEVRLTPQQDHPLLDSCWLSEARMIGGVNWPAGTSVSATTGYWLLLWRRAGTSQDLPASAFGFPLDYMSATYNTKIELDAWEGYSSNSMLRTGDYVFPSTGANTTFNWQPGDNIRVEGSGKNVKTGKAATCVLVHAQSHQSEPCKPDAN